MNIQEYISSGILESYVLGLSSKEESMEVEKYATLYPEVKSEIESIQAALNSYASGFEKTPPVELKKKIWSAIQENTIATTSDAVTTSGKVIDLPASRSSDMSRWLVAASLILFLIGTGLNVFLYNKWKSIEKEMAALNSEKEYMAQQFQIQQTNYEQTRDNYNFIVNPGTKTITLKGVPQYAGLQATVYWNTETKHVFIASNSLPAQPSDKQYQLWAIVDGKPVDAGVFDSSPGNATIQKMKDFDSAQAFAVTLEKRGGSPTPTMEAMYVIGNI